MVSLEKTVAKTPLLQLGLAHIFIGRGLDNFGQSLPAKYGITYTECLVLNVIAESSASGGIRVTDLADKFDVKTTYITALLNSLRSKQFVETRLDIADARVRLTVISKKGTVQLQAVEAHVQQTVFDRLDGLVTAEEFRLYSSVAMRIAGL